ncbi:UvrD-helicase domain-containing protein [Campylobacter jejuni]
MAPQKIMLLTFTNKASKEMIGRLGKFLIKILPVKYLQELFIVRLIPYLEMRIKI